MEKNYMMECKDCEFYDKEDDRCTAFVCSPFECDVKLPCEETDAVTLYATRGNKGKEICEGFL